MQKKTVLIVHNKYKFRGGEDIVVENEKALLEQNGHKVLVYYRDNNNLDNMSLFHKLLLPFATIYSFKTAREIKKLIKQNNVNIVHVHNTIPLISPSVYTAAKSCGCKVVQTIHNFRFLCVNGLFYRDNQICEKCLQYGKKIALKHKCYRNSKLQTFLLLLSQQIAKLFKLYDNIDKVICLTEFNYNKLSQFFKKSQLVVKPNFVHYSDLPVVPCEERISFIYVGRIEHYKGIFELVDFFLKHKEFDLKIVGTGQDFEKLKEKLSEQSANNIDLLGFVDHDKTLQLISKSKAIIVPSLWYEGFPMTIVEALSFSTPVMGSDIGNVGCIAKDSVGVFSNEQQLFDLLVNLNDAKQQQLQIDKAYQLFVTRYCPEKNYQILNDIYNS